MKTVPPPTPSSVLSAAWRIAVAVLPLGIGLAAAASLLPGADDLSAPTFLMIRIVVGVVICAFSFAVLRILVRRAGRVRTRDIGLAEPRSAWLLALWGAVLWAVPAAAAFGVFALLGAPLTVGTSVPELAGTALLLMLAVLLAEAVPEEVVFRGYIATVLGSVTGQWWAIIIQALVFTIFGGLLRQDLNPIDLSLFFTMGVGFGYLRMVTGSIWMSVGFHAVFQTGSQLILTHDAVIFMGGTDSAMLALGVVPFTVAAIVIGLGVGPRSSA